MPIRPKKIVDMDDFHFHLLRHTYTTNLLSHRTAPKDAQDLLGHSDVSATMNIYAHATREAKRTSARLLNKVVGTALKNFPSFLLARGKMREKGQNKVTKTLETPVFSRGIEISTEKLEFVRDKK